MKRIALISVLLSILTGINCNAEKIRIACIGDSITYGAYIENREQNSYPAQLQAYLGEDYDVRNFGLNGTTLLSKGDYPYISYPAYQASLDFNPDIVFIKLGSNDAKAHNRIYIADDFKKQYMDLIRTYRNLPSKPRVILLSPIYSFVEEERSIWEPVIANEIIPRIKEVAYECDVEIINMHNMFGNQLQWELLPDRLHPSSIGAGMMARKLYDYLTVEEDEETDIISKFPLKPVREFNFHGFKGYAYNNDGVEYYIVKPHHTAKGNPWIWRARFWGHEPQTDINLLEQGFHVAYCEVGELYGSPKAVKRWDDFYKLAVKAGLSKKAVLEGMSRGGLIIYNWAVKNTDKVACIYADAPVLDLKSWPLGQGKYRGCDECVQTMMGAYEFSTMEELLTWKGNPIDHAKKLAKAGIPMIHVVGDADEVVPVDENTTIFEDRLEEYGYDLYVIHKPGVHHHPHSLYNPEPIVSYILESVGMARNRCIHPVPGNEYPHITPQICPQPLSCQLSSTDFVPYENIQLACPDDQAIDWAKRHLKEWYGKLAPEVAVSAGEASPLADEEYSIEISEDGVRVEAGSIKGARYAFYTLRQIAIAGRGTLKVEGWIVPKGSIKDKPMMNFRGIHICWFHETEPWEVERLIRLAAYYKMNHAVIESWGTFRSDVAPWFGWPDGTMTKKEIKRLRKIADDLGITLIPQINVFGHATQSRGGACKHATLDINPEYQTLFEPVDGWNFCLSNPMTRKVLQDMIVERLEAFGNPPYFHIGGDEATIPSCPKCSTQPYSKLFLEHIQAMNETITEHGARTMMWHDMLLERGDPRWNGFYANGNSETSEGFLKFPRDIIICDWYYDNAHEAYPTLDYFKEQGFSVLTCPWLNAGGIMAQSRYAYESGIDGILGTLWHHYFGDDMVSTYFVLSNSMWNPNAPVYGRGEHRPCVNTHIRQVGWDMKLKDPRHAGTYYDEIPPEPFLNN